jgi:hypothetical protein
MATSFAHSHSHRGIAEIGRIPVKSAAGKQTRKPGLTTRFVRDFFEDIQQKPLQDAKFAKHDMFREHINAMSISYFTLILILIVGSVFLLPAMIPLLTQ